MAVVAARKESEQVLDGGQGTSREFEIYGDSAFVRLEGTIAGDWVVQSSRKNANPRVWQNEFEPADALTTAIPIAQVPGARTLVYRIHGGTANADLTGHVDDVYTAERA